MNNTNNVPLSALRALSPSFLFMKATKPQFLPLAFSSSDLGHIIFMLASGPYLPNTSMSCCSVICTQDEEEVSAPPQLSITPISSSHLRVEVAQVQVGGRWIP